MIPNMQHMPTPPPAPMPEKDRGLLEADVESKVCAYARYRGFWVRKFVSPANRGAPDRIFKRACVETFWVEFKRPGKKRTFPSGKHERIQAREHQNIRDAGGTVFIIDTVEEGKRLIDRISMGFSPTEIGNPI